MKFLLFTTFETRGKSDVWKTDRSRETLSICWKMSCHFIFNLVFLILTFTTNYHLLPKTDFLKLERTSGDFYSKWGSMFLEKYPRGIAGHIQSNLCWRSEKANKTIPRNEIWIGRSSPAPCEKKNLYSDKVRATVSTFYDISSFRI